MGILDPFFNPKPLAQDHSILAREAMQMDKLSDRGGLVKKRGLVVSCDYFSGTEGQFHHWRDHQTGKRPRLPVSLSNYPEGLVLSTAAVPYTAGREDSETSSYKNLSQFRDAGLISFSCFWTHGGSVSFSSIQFGSMFRSGTTGPVGSTSCSTPTARRPTIPPGSSPTTAPTAR